MVRCHSFFLGPRNLPHVIVSSFPLFPVSSSLFPVSSFGSYRFHPQLSLFWFTWEPVLFRFQVGFTGSSVGDFRFSRFHFVISRFQFWWFPLFPVSISLFPVSSFCSYRFHPHHSLFCFIQEPVLFRFQVGFVVSIVGDFRLIPFPFRYFTFPALGIPVFPRFHLVNSRFQFWLLPIPPHHSLFWCIYEFVFVRFLVVPDCHCWWFSFFPVSMSLISVSIFGGFRYFPFPFR